MFQHADFLILSLQFILELDCYHLLILDTIGRGSESLMLSGKIIKADGISGEGME